MKHIYSNSHDDKLRQDALMLGLPVPEEKSVYIWEVNLPVLSLFQKLQTQWRVGFCGATGLDYTVIQPTADLLGIPITPDDFDLLQKCEQTVLEIWEKQKQS